MAQFHVFLGVVPSAAGGGHHDGQHEARTHGSNEHATQGLHAQDETGGQRSGNGHQTRYDHLLKRALGGYVHTFVVIGLSSPFHQPGDFSELAADLINDGHRRPPHSLHGKSGEEERQHSAEEYAHNGLVVQQIDHLYLGRNREGRQQSQRSQRGGTDGKSLSCGRCGVPQGVQSVGPLPYFRIKLGLLRDSAGVIGYRTVSIGRQRDPQCR